MKTNRWVGLIFIGLLVGVLALLNQSSPGQAPGTRPGVVWEYKVVYDQGSRDGTEVLNEWGQKRWELVAVSEVPVSRAIRF